MPVTGQLPGYSGYSRQYQTEYIGSKVTGDPHHKFDKIAGKTVRLTDHANYYNTSLYQNSHNADAAVQPSAAGPRVSDAPLGRDELIGKRYSAYKAEVMAKQAELEATRPKANPKFSLKAKDARPFTPLRKPANEWASTYRTFMPPDAAHAPASQLAATQAAAHAALIPQQPEAQWGAAAAGAGAGAAADQKTADEPVGGAASAGQSAGAAAAAGGAAVHTAAPASAAGYTSGAAHIHRDVMNVNSLAYQNRNAHANFMRLKTQPTGYALDYGRYGSHPTDRLQTTSDGKVAYTASASSADLFAGTVKGSLGLHVPGYTGHVPGSRVNHKLLNGGSGNAPTGVHATHSHKSKDNLTENYRHNLPGYSGYQPTNLVNDRGPRNPKGRQPPPTGSNTGLILASMKSS